MTSDKGTVALVTGGAGFIGSHLVDRLIAAGHRVVVVDDLSSGREANLPEDAELERLDIRDAKLGELIDSVRPAVIYHVAAQISVSVSAREPKLDADVNVMGSLNVLDAARAAGTRSFVFISTGGAMYGEPEQLPAPETLPPRPGSPYGASKLAVENYLPVYQRLFGLEYSIMRLANVYGPRQDPHGEAGVVAIFTRAMLSGVNPTIFGDGQDERDYVYVGDVVDALMKAGRDGKIGPYNIGTGIGTSVNSLYASLADICGFPGRAKYAPPRPGDLHKVSLDPSKAKRDLGWTAGTELVDGLAATVKWFRENAATR